MVPHVVAQFVVTKSIVAAEPAAGAILFRIE
jgi:hypothetical protein